MILPKSRKSSHRRNQDQDQKNQMVEHLIWNLSSSLDHLKMKKLALKNLAAALSQNRSFLINRSKKMRMIPLKSFWLFRITELCIRNSQTERISRLYSFFTRMELSVNFASCLLSPLKLSKSLKNLKNLAKLTTTKFNLVMEAAWKKKNTKKKNYKRWSRNLDSQHWWDRTPIWIELGIYRAWSIKVRSISYLESWWNHTRSLISLFLLWSSFRV